MKKLPVLFLIVLFVSCVFVNAQTGDAFAELDNYVKTKQRGSFGGEEETVTLFNAARKRLGDNFKAELLKYLSDNNIEKYYWVSLYIDSEDYLQGNERLPELSLLVKQNGLAQAESQKEEDTFVSVMGLNVTAAILSKQLKKDDLAKLYKASAEKLLKKEMYQGTFPALTEQDSAIYDAIK